MVLANSIYKPYTYVPNTSALASSRNGSISNEVFHLCHCPVLSSCLVCISDCRVLNLLDNSCFQALWSFCVYLEAVSVLPQLRMIQKSKVRRFCLLHACQLLALLKGDRRSWLKVLRLLPGVDVV